MNANWRILLPEPLDAPAESALSAAADVIRPSGTAAHDLLAAIPDCDALVVRTSTSVTRELLAAGGRLRVVGVAGVGLDRVDLGAAAEFGVRVVHTPGASSDAVAELAVAFMLQLLRPVPRLAEAYRQGRYAEARRESHGNELREQTIGVIGMGRIGSRVARMCAAGFGARVLYNDIVPVGPFDFAAESASKEAILEQCDFVSLHLPLTALTRNLIGDAALGRMRPAARLINTARGEIVDTPALAAALKSGRLAGAALDVTNPEPLPVDHALFGLPQCLLTPHIAARTHGALRRMYDVVLDVIEVLRSTAPRV